MSQNCDQRLASETPGTFVNNGPSWVLPQISRIRTSESLHREEAHACFVGTVCKGLDFLYLCSHGRKVLFLDCIIVY